MGRRWHHDCNSSQSCRSRSVYSRDVGYFLVLPLSICASFRLKPFFVFGLPSIASGRLPREPDLLFDEVVSLGGKEVQVSSAIPRRPEISFETCYSMSIS